MAVAQGLRCWLILRMFKGRSLCNVDGWNLVCYPYYQFGTLSKGIKCLPVRNMKDRGCSQGWTDISAGPGFMRNGHTSSRHWCTLSNSTHKLIRTYSSAALFVPFISRGAGCAVVLIPAFVRHTCDHSASAATLGSSADSEQLIEVLAPLLNCTKQEALILMQQTSRLLNRHTSQDDLKKTLHYLLVDAQISPEQIKENPWMLDYSLSTLHEKITILKKVVAKLETPLLSLLKLSSEQLKMLMEHRVKLTSLESLVFLAKNLDISIVKLFDLVINRPQILRSDVLRIKRIVELLKDAGVPTDVMLKNLWIFRHSDELISARLSRLRAEQVPIKIWYLRCPEETFENYIRIHKQNLEILHPYPNTTEYLAAKLNCSKDVILSFAEKSPRVLAIKPPKLEKVLHLLISSGFKSEEILRCPRILCYSLNTLQKRLTDFHELGFRPLTLNAFLKSKKRHEEFLKILKHQKEKNDQQTKEKSR